MTSHSANPALVASIVMVNTWWLPLVSILKLTTNLLLELDLINVHKLLTGDCGAGHYCVWGVDRQYPGGLNASLIFNNTCYNDR